MSAARTSFQAEMNANKRDGHDRRRGHWHHHWANSGM